MAIGTAPRMNRKTKAKIAEIKKIFFFFESHSRIKARLKIARAGMQGDYEMERFRYIDTLIAVYVTCCFCPRQTYKLLQVDATQTARELGLSCR